MRWLPLPLRAGPRGVLLRPLPQRARRKGRGRMLLLRALVRTGLPRAALVLLAEADALRSQKLDRRAALWQVRGLSDMAELPLFAHQPVAIHHVPLPVMTNGRARHHRLPDRRPVAEVTPDALPALAVQWRRRAELRAGRGPDRWCPSVRRRRGAGASAAGQRQCRVLHHRGRDRHRQHRGLVQPAGPVPPRHPRAAVCCR